MQYSFFLSNIVSYLYDPDPHVVSPCILSSSFIPFARESRVRMHTYLCVCPSMRVQ